MPNIVVPIVADVAGSDYLLCNVAGQPFTSTSNFNVYIIRLLEPNRMTLPFVHVRPAPAPRRNLTAKSETAFATLKFSDSGRIRTYSAKGHWVTTSLSLLGWHYQLYQTLPKR